MNEASYRIVEGPYLGDILDQPQALLDTLHQFQMRADLESGIRCMREIPHRRVVLTGMGSSLHSLYPTELKLTACGENVVRVEAAELIYSMPTLLERDSIIVTVSQSGKSAEIVQLLNRNAGRATIIGVTNTESSPLAERSDFVALTHCGDEFSVSTKTYIGTLAALELFSAAWSGEAIESHLTRLEMIRETFVRPYLQSWRSHATSLAGEMTGITRVFYVGRGTSLATCGTAALTTKESTRFSSEAMSSAAFRHGPMEVIAPDTMVFVFEGDTVMRALNQKLVCDIRSWGGRAELVGPDAELDALQIPDLPGEILPLVEILPVQMLTLALAAIAGREAGRFAFASKVTVEE